MVGAHCYALYRGPRRDRQPRWIPAGSRDQGVWDAHCKRSCHAPSTDMAMAYRSATSPIQNQRRSPHSGKMPSSLATPGKIPTEVDKPINDALPQPPPTTRMLDPGSNATGDCPCSDDQFGMHNPRRSERLRRKHIPTGQDASG